ncbi:MAG: DUF1801 domain-containing protein [Rhodobacter sp.]|nr:DUF1801 domain-containing protein [Rhodobacter sp.]
MSTRTDPPIPPEVSAVFDSYPAAMRARLLEIRGLIYRVALDCDAGPLTETLKWGEPAYLTQATKSGTTIRLGRVKDAAGAAVLFNCNTALVAGFREQFDGVFRFSGKRALLLDIDAPLPEDALAICLARALSYHRDKRKGAA